MTRDKLLEQLTSRARRHAREWRAFRVGVFLRWARNQDDAWLRWASTQPMATLTAQRREHTQRVLLAQQEREAEREAGLVMPWF